MKTVIHGRTLDTEKGIKVCEIEAELPTSLLFI